MTPAIIETHVPVVQFVPSMNDTRKPGNTFECQCYSSGQIIDSTSDCFNRFEPVRSTPVVDINVSL